ncbi:MAG: hypothetical protein V3W19_09105, partial [Desulfatiglandales bacterium]
EIGKRLENTLSTEVSYDRSLLISECHNPRNSSTDLNLQWGKLCILRKKTMYFGGKLEVSFM